MVITFRFLTDRPADAAWYGRGIGESNQRKNDIKIGHSGGCLGMGFGLSVLDLAGLYRGKGDVVGFGLVVG